MKKILIYTLAIIEGAGLLVLELCSAKIIETQYGNSLYVWASVLSITLLGLAIGYYLGGKFSEKENNLRVLSLCLFVSGLFVICLPPISKFLLKNVIDYSVMTSSFLSSTIFLLPPMICFGMIGPILVSLLSKVESTSGKATGNIYALSTISSVFNVLLVGLFLMTKIGISSVCFFYGIVLVVGSIIAISSSKIWKGGIGALFLLLSFSFTNKLDKDPTNKERLYKAAKVFGDVPMKNMRILYETSGVFGTARVVDIIVQLSPQQRGRIRGLMVNNTWQTLNNADNNVSMLDYVAAMTGIISAYPNHKKILHIGLGGGQVSRLFHEQGKSVTAVEIDERIELIARKYFNLPKEVNVVIDDGRHYINKSKDKNDIIVLNAFNNGIPAWNLFTLESFKKSYELTNDDGLFIIEIGGNIKGEEDQVLASICQTVEKAGWKIKLIKTKETTNADYICVAYKTQEPDFSKMNYQILTYQKNMKDMEVDRRKVHHKDQITLTDDNPILSQWISDRLNED